MRLLINITGILAALSLAANFITCFSMPWSKQPSCWKGKYPGPDKCDYEGYRRLASFHRVFVWLTIIFASLHIILAIIF